MNIWTRLVCLCLLLFALLAAICGFLWLAKSPTKMGYVHRVDTLFPMVHW